MMPLQAYRVARARGMDRGVAADHVAHVQLRHFIAAHVEHLVAGAAQLRDHGVGLLVTVAEREADEHARPLAAL